MTLQPLGDRIVAEPIEAQAKTAAGILLPDQAKTKTQQAKVLAVGKEVKEVKAGDTIVHTEYGPNRFKQDGGKELLIIKEEDVLAVVKTK